MKIRTIESVQHGKGKNECKGIVLHHTAGSLAGATNVLQGKATNNGKRVFGSYHAIIDIDGTVYQCLTDDKIAYHAGVSEWRGRKNCNDWTLGVAVPNAPRVLPEAQLHALCEWVEERLDRYGLGLSDVTTHANVARPKGRKVDMYPEAFEQVIKELTKRRALNIAEK